MTVIPPRWSRCICPAQFGDKPDDVNAYAASSFYAVDRYASYKTDWGSFTVRTGWILIGPLHHVQRRTPVLEAAADALGRFSALAVRF